MLNKEQIKLVQCAARGAGLRGDRFSPDGRYYMLLGQYRTNRCQKVTSCKQLTRDQMDDFLAICESLGWRHPGKPEGFYRDKVRHSREVDHAVSYAQIAVIKHLAGDLGMNDEQLGAFIGRMAKGQTSLIQLMDWQAGKVIEGLKAMLGRRDGRTYETVADVAQEYMEPQISQIDTD